MNDELVQQVHDEWKDRGFPYYPTDENWRNHIYKQQYLLKGILLLIEE